MIFDAHAHIYPDAIALKAAHSIAEFYDIPVLCDGTLGTLLEIGAKNGITRFLVHSVAMSPKRTRHIDDYIAQCVREHPDKLVGFGTLHPDSPDIKADIDYAISLGLKGIKIHPDMQLFALDEPRSLKMFEALEGRLPC